MSSRISVAAFDYGDTLIGVNLTALDDQDDPLLVPVNQSFRGDAVTWLPQIPDTQHSTSSAETPVPGWLTAASPKPEVLPGASGARPRLPCCRPNIVAEED
ncbi:hypothetical protein [Micromonospora matsumotoense]|uniref:hypothetical protein n=1 Tax=Micromonospora matsumotoense TaxID=121616 RepID=UPI00114CFE31|nr:hypothetical protein [Micromonospora matsumotoense]